MLLALLMLVVGRLGGLLVPEADRDMGGANTGSLRLSMDGSLVSSGVALGGGTDLGGGMLPPETDLAASGGGGVPEGGGGVPAIDRGPALGGGGVAVLASTFSAPGFLLIQRLSSGSYTKLLCSPKFALTALGASGPPGLGDSARFANQPPKPQPFLPACCSAARFAV
jgi:hypothetical protein